MMKRIVVAVDSSSCANRALEFAISLAKAEGSTLSFCSVADPSAVHGALEPMVIVERTLEAIDHDADHAVSEATAKAKSAGVAADGTALKGDPAREILAFAERLSADAIVMGTHGRSGLPRLLMGSVAEGVLRSATIPVVTVRADARIEDPSPEVSP
jgi:nucleotide-binding universal stress UspA family protein